MRDLSPRARTVLWALLVAGLAGRVALAFATRGVDYDVDSFHAVRTALENAPLDIYSTVNGHPDNRWPYPSGFFPLIYAASGLERLLGLPLHGLVQLPAIAADALIAYLVQDHLRGRGASERVRVAAAALVLIGPSFWIISGYHGQIDSFAILPAVAALWLWDRNPPGLGRALAAGALVGLAVSMKTVPGLMLFALLPAVRSRREVTALVAPAVLIPLVAVAPWLVSDFSGIVESIREHRGLPGFGGLGLLVQPELAEFWLHDQYHRPSALSDFLLERAPFVLLPLMAPLLVLVLVRRLEPTAAAALLWPACVLFNPGFGFQYVVWALPFLLMAGRLRAVAAVQLGLFLPAAMLYWHPFGFDSTTVYVVLMTATWLAATTAVVAAAVRQLSSTSGRPPPRAPGAAGPPVRST